MKKVRVGPDFLIFLFFSSFGKDEALRSADDINRKRMNAPCQTEPDINSDRLLSRRTLFSGAMDEGDP